MTNSSGFVVQYAYDIMDRVTNISWRTTSGATLGGFSYEYDALGRIVSREHMLGTNAFDRTNTCVATTPSSSEDFRARRRGRRRYAYSYGFSDRLASYGRAGAPRTPQSEDYITTTFTFDGANQLVASTTDGVTTKYAYDAAGRLVKEGSKTYRYGYLDKVLSVTDGKSKFTYGYHVDGQLASADYGDGRAEDFEWDGLALVKRGGERFINEPHIGGGNPVLSSGKTTYFNDMLGTTVGSKAKGKKYSAAALTAFGERLLDNADDSSSAIRSLGEGWFTGKPYVEGLGHAFLFRNYRAGLAKWQTADPLGYPDGWNHLAYCGNGVSITIDLWGGELRIVGRDTEDAPPVIHDMGMHIHDERECHWYIIDEYVYDITIMQDFTRKRRWETIDGLEDILNGIGFGLDISGGLISFTVVGTIPAAGVILGGIIFHAAAEMLDHLNGWIDVPVGERIRVRNDSPRFVGSFELHVFE